MIISKEERVRIVADRISKKVSMGGGNVETHTVVDPNKLADFLIEEGVVKETIQVHVGNGGPQRP